ncbi:MAG: N-acetylneuraminate synthase family protein [Acidobacteriota bacterium]|nr:N-acetylneuraminate synthase family protein [Acidobacteriota bacterium]
MSRATVRIGDRSVGDGEPVLVIAEIGINHNGSLEMAKKLIDGAYLSGVGAVKFQKRTPERCVPAEQWHQERDTPWGRMTYIEYRQRMEFGQAEFETIDRYCRERGVLWFASCWDEESVDFIERFDPPCYKIASASLTDGDLLRKLRSTGRPLILSTGMSTMEEIEEAVHLLGREQLLIAHATSTYPCPPAELNLRMIETLRRKFPECPIGYSGHETGLAPTWAAVVLGASFVERHITLDRALWGSDQAASVEIGGFLRLVSNIRDIEGAMGDGVKRVYPAEQKQAEKLRRVKSQVPATAARPESSEGGSRT